MKRFPFIKQKDSMQCGVACLASICEYYGKKYSTQFISKLCSCTPTGISLQSLKLAAEQLGFDSMCVLRTQQRRVNVRDSAGCELLSDFLSLFFEHNETN